MGRTHERETAAGRAKRGRGVARATRDDDERATGTKAQATMKEDEAFARELHRALNGQRAREARRARERRETTREGDRAHGDDPGILPSC